MTNSLLQALAEHLADAASTITAIPSEIAEVHEVRDEDRTDGNDREFTMILAGRTFNITIEEVLP